MEILTPIFQIPDSNNRRDKKTGRRSAPVLRIAKSKFIKHRNDRAREAGLVIEQSQSVDSKPWFSEDRLFYEINFNEKALSKTAQPRALLDKNHIDVYAQISKKTFLASSTTRNLKAFQDSTKAFTLSKNKNDSAYLSAITKIGQISKADKLTFKPDANLQSRAYLFLADLVSDEEGRQIAVKISEQAETTAEYFVAESGSKVIYGSFASSFINEISDPDPRNPVVRVEKSIDFLPSQDLPLEYDYDSVTIDDPDLDAKVAVIDSGTFANQLFGSLILDREDFVNDAAQEDLSHGTFVAGRTIFGNDIENQVRVLRRLKAKTRVLDVKVLKKLPSSDNEILTAIKSIIANPKYSDIKVFNLSLNNDADTSLKDGRKSFFTRELDSIAYKHGLLIVVTAGNQRNVSLGYPACLYDPKSLITSPGDIVNGFSVGSIADTHSSRALALINEPSPFTRVGLPGCKKPDLVHFGGNLDQFGNYSGIGVKSLSTNHGKISENVGTSFAAPLVSSIAAQIYAYLKSVGINSIDLSKALLLHSASYDLPLGSQVSYQDLHRTVGFGVPDIDKALNCAQAAATFFYTGKIEAKKSDKNEVKEYKHKIKFAIPPELVGRGKKIKVKGTLVYTPLISEVGNVDYTLADVEVNLHYLNSRGTDKSAGLTSDSGDNRTKWNTVKSFEKTISSYKEGDWEIWLNLTTRGKADVKDYTQEYALVVTVEDATPDMSKRINLHQIIKERHPIYVPINQRIQSRVRSS